MGKPDLPTLYINTASANATEHVVYLTLGILTPATFANAKELEQWDSTPTPVFSCAMHKEMVHYLIDVLTTVTRDEAP